MRGTGQVLAASTLFLLTGCAVVPTPNEVVQRVSAFVDCMAEEQRLAADQRRARMQAQMHRHQLQREGLRKEAQMLHEAMITEAQNETEAINNEFEQSVRTKLGLNVDYGLDIGKPVIDVAQMKDAIAKHDREMQLYNAKVQAIRKKNEEKMIRQTEAQIRTGRFGEKESQSQANCTCAAPSEAQHDKEPQINEPTPPTIDVLKLSVPITLKLNGDGKVEDTTTRRTPKTEPQTELQRCGAQCGPCSSSQNPNCDAPSATGKPDVGPNASKEGQPAPAGENASTKTRKPSSLSSRSVTSLQN